MLYGQSCVESNRRGPSDQAGRRPAVPEEEMTEHPFQRAVLLAYINSDMNGDKNGTLNPSRVV
jgi:hypothetical protein